MTQAVRRWIAGLLTLSGAAILIWVVVSLMLASSHRRQDEEALERARSAPKPQQQPEPPRAPASLASGEPIGMLELVRVGLSGVVVEGDSDAVLDRAIGHLPDTPLPWNVGNSALAAHRDALFRPLKGVHVGDLLRLKTPHGDFDYRVRETLIVMPEDVWVLDPSPVSMLTLISCYPFNYVGHAPKRFIVRAEQIAQNARNAPDVNLKPVLFSPPSR